MIRVYGSWGNGETMHYYSSAGITVAYEPRYDRLKKQSEKYEIAKPNTVDLTIDTEDGRIEEYTSTRPMLSNEVYEYLYVGSVFNSFLLVKRGIMLHASCVVLDNEAYCFSATSGTGKSTHTSLWLEVFKDREPYILNDDKPALVYRDGRFYACGTPFSGKYDISVNKFVPLKAIAYIKRNETNSIKKIAPIQALPLLLEQTVRPDLPALTNRMMINSEKLLEDIPYYVLDCNMDPQAAVVAYNGMKGE